MTRGSLRKSLLRSKFVLLNHDANDSESTAWPAFVQTETPAFVISTTSVCPTPIWTSAGLTAPLEFPAQDGPRYGPVVVAPRSTDPPAATRGHKRPLNMLPGPRL